MRHLLFMCCGAVLSACMSLSAQSKKHRSHGKPATTSSLSDASFIRQNYIKREYYVPMRDGVKLFTAVYTPKDASDTKRYPILMQRTCYGVGPYGEGVHQFRRRLGPSSYLMRDKYIFVYQDVRGRYKSEGVFVHMPPYVSSKYSDTLVDEVSDAYDAVDWLVKHLPGNNGRVGIWGISYPGYYAAAATMCGHPALKAVSPQAPISDFFFDDFHHNGAFLESYFLTFPVFGVPKKGPQTKNWFQLVRPDTQDGFQFYKALGPLSNGDKYYAHNVFWRDVVNHPNYDVYWRSRSLLPHFQGNVKTAVMVVGGWFDAEDLYGPLHIYQAIERRNPRIYNTLVMTPFGHGVWSYEQGHTLHNDIYFGDSVATFYQRNIERPFFEHFLKSKGDGKTGLPEAYMYNTGLKKWQLFSKWPVYDSKQRLYLSQGHTLTEAPLDSAAFSFISDPDKPVPSSENWKEMLSFTPHNYMSEDQRFAATRPDVLVFEGPVLSSDVTFSGDILAHLRVATTGTDADWIVKLIDVYPPDEPNHPYLPNPRTTLGNYQQMVRSEVMRGRFRESFEHPVPFLPNTPTTVDITLQDVLHTFKKGHRIMIQVQSTWFPLIDRNPQRFVENIYKAKASDFQPAVHTLYTGSYVEVGLLKQQDK